MSVLQEMKAQLAALEAFRDESKSSKDEAVAEGNNQQNELGETSAVQSNSPAQSEFVKPQSTDNSQKNQSEKPEKNSAIKIAGSIINSVARFLGDRLTDLGNLISNGPKYALEFRKKMNEFRNNPPVNINSKISTLRSQINLMEKDPEAAQKAEEAKSNGQLGEFLGGLIGKALGSAEEASSSIQSSAGKSKNFNKISGVNGVFETLKNENVAIDIDAKQQEENEAVLKGEKKKNIENSTGHSAA